jgi:uncharacterized membrane protein
LIVLILVAMTMISALAYFIIDYPKSISANRQATEKNSAAAHDGSTVAIPVAQLADGVAHFFEHPSGDVTIRYFIVKSSDGILRAAFDACDVCWSAGKGYEQQGDDMVCRNCGRRFPTTKINEAAGGCNPAPLKRAIIGDRLMISIGDIELGRSYFDF